MRDELDGRETPAAAATPSTGPIPVEQAALDPRSIARASLQAGRNASLWWTCAGVAVSVLVALVVGTRAGATCLAVLLAVCAVVRAVRPEPGPPALSVRRKAVDVTVLGGLAVALAFLAQILPEGSRGLL